MADYHAPLREYRFVLQDLLGLSAHGDVPGFAEASEDIVEAVLKGGARFVEEVWAPLNQSGDEKGVSFENGVVRTPEGFKDAFQGYYAGGWNALSTPAEWGGQGLPSVLATCMTEMAMSANLSLSTYVGLTGGVAGTLMRIAPDEIKALYVPKLVAGEWSGTMNLTEPHCGTDLKLMRTRAEEQEDGSYRITGTKIFITGGEHDMADNIVHLVLAKVPAEGEGLGAVNLFLVPKFLVNADGSLGPRNDVACGGVEHKMGIRASATATLNYEDAWAIRLSPKPKPTASDAGDENRTKRRSSGGMAGMFALMNAARLGVGLQGIALAEVAYQNAVAYARERRAGRALSGAVDPNQPADPIIVHPDIRRMLLHMRAFIEGARALILWLTMEQQLAQRGGDAAALERAQDLMNLLTPVIKAHFTDVGFDCVNMAMQCYGGYGYIRDHGMEQFVRDARISQLYEGANGVQALDLVGRRLPAENGRYARTFFQTVTTMLDGLAEDGAMAEFVDPVRRSLGDLTDATMWLAQNAPGNRDHAGAGSSDYLRLMGHVSIGLMWARMASIARDKPEDADHFCEMKLATARFYMARVMPETTSLLARIKAGADSVMAPKAEWF